MGDAPILQRSDPGRACLAETWVGKEGEAQRIPRIGDGVPSAFVGNSRREL